MLKDPKGPLPRMRALRVFEAAGRRLSFIRAAEELGSHQSNVSRYIAELEYEVGFLLFERSHRGVKLTPAGEIYHRGVSIGLQRIAAAGIAASSIKEKQRVVIACSHSLSHQFIMPRFDNLRQAVGNNVILRIVTIDYDFFDYISEKEADLIATYDEPTIKQDDRVILFSEAFTPVCSPGFANTHEKILAQPVTEWGSLPFLRLSRNHDWANWHDWFETVGYPSPLPQYTGFEDYVYLIQAAIEGKGLALGWRYYIEEYLKQGTLVAVNGSYVERDRSCFLILTERGQQRPIARRCLEIFANLKNESLNVLQPQEV